MKRFLTLFMLACLVFGAASTATADARPSYQNGFARSASESARPQDWDGLVGLWVPALGQTGVTLHDVSGRGKHGTLTNMDVSTDWVIGSQGYALDFDGTNDHIALPAFNWPGGPVTVLYQQFIGSITNTESAFGLTGGAGSPNPRFQAHGSWSDGNLYWDYGVPAVGRVSTSLAAYDGTWVDVALTAYGSSGLQSIYLNGVSVASATKTGNHSGTAEFRIGSWDDGVAQYYITGRIQQFRLYNRVLNAAHIKEIYQDPLGIVRLDEPQAFAIIEAVAASPTSQIIIIAWLGGFGSLTMLGFIRRKKPNAR